MLRCFAISGIHSLVLILIASALGAADTVVTTHGPWAGMTAAAIAARTATAAVPTAIVLPAGPTTLGAAIAALKSGGPVQLSPDIDPLTPITLPGPATTFWDGIIAICAAGQLRMVPGEDANDDDDNAQHHHLGFSDSGTAIAVTTGPVLLDRLAGAGLWRPRLISNGVAVMLIDEERFVQVDGRWKWSGTLSARLEPRLVGQWSFELKVTPALEQNYHGLSGWIDAGARGQFLRNGKATLRLLLPTTISTVLRPGSKTVVAPGVTIGLLGAENEYEQITGPALWIRTVDAKAAAIDSATVEVDGQSIELGNNGSTGGEAYTINTWSLPATTAAHVITCNAQLIGAVVTVPKFGFGATLDDVVAAQAATTAAMELPAGALTLAAAIERLNQQHPITVTMDINDQRSATVAAFRGSWWGAVMAVADAFALEPAFPTTWPALPDSPTLGQATGRELAVAPIINVSLKPRGSATRALVVIGSVLAEVETLSAVEIRDHDGIRKQSRGRIRFISEPGEGSGCLIHADLNENNDDDLLSAPPSPSDREEQVEDPSAAGWVTISPWPVGPVTFTLQTIQSWSAPITRDGFLALGLGAEILIRSSSGAALHPQKLQHVNGVNRPRLVVPGGGPMPAELNHEPNPDLAAEAAEAAGAAGAAEAAGATATAAIPALRRIDLRFHSERVQIDTITSESADGQESAPMEFETKYDTQPIMRLLVRAPEGVVRLSGLRRIHHRTVTVPLPGAR